MSELSIIFESNSTWDYFLPISGDSQAFICNLVRLPLIFNRACSPPKPLGTPTKLSRINGDGNCLFRSFSYIITGRQSYHSLIRKKIVDHMKTIESDLFPHTGSSVDEYLLRTKMGNVGVWGTDIEILTAASLFCCDIFVYTQFGNNKRWIKFSRTMLNEPLPQTDHSLYIQNCNQVHFDVVKDVSQNVSPKAVEGECGMKFFRTNVTEKQQEIGIMSTLEKRLLAKNLIPFDVGGGGDCFFKAVSHQLYQNPNFHQDVRQAGVNYICAHPEQFIESVSDKSWLEYINNMSLCGTWCDAIIVQAVANALSCVIDITESAVNFSLTTIVQPTHHIEKPVTIHIGHLDEFHYVSTVNLVTTGLESELSKHMSSTMKTTNLPSLHQNTVKTSLLQNPCVTGSKKTSQIHLSPEAKNDVPPEKKQRVTGIDALIKSFHKSIECGPEYICTCCDQLWFRNSVQHCNCDKYDLCSPNMIKLCITSVKSVENSEWICKSCHSSLLAGKLPVFSKANGMGFPEKPDILNLSALEERMVSPRIPFMQLRELPRGGQLSIHGNVVNVPADVNSTVNSLPRPLNDLQTIPIKLKRRLIYKHHYMLENVRPLNVLQAARYLVENSKLFKDEGIEINTSYLDSCDYQNNKNQPLQLTENEKQNEQEEQLFDESDAWCEVEERPSGVVDTLLVEPDPAQDFDHVLSFAPGEGNKPLGLFIDKDAEYLSFPSIFCGKKRLDNADRQIPVHYSTVCKWELRSQDRRVAESVPNIFYKLKKLQIKRIQDSAGISLRKCKTKGKRYTAKDFKTDANVNKLIRLDEGYRVLRNLRGSPPYFEKCKKDLFAMIRQLGNPTWFCSFSAAETRWTHLLKILARLVENRNYSENEIRDMTWQKKSELIRKDPVTCARNFEHMFRVFLNTFLKSKEKPISEIQDYFHRVEFQQRGSPHIHALFWVKGAPQLGKNHNSEITAFVDTYVTCKGEIDGVDPELLNLQLHRHAKTCKKKGQNICRFNFPVFPMPSTMILHPLDLTILQDEDVAQLKANLTRITNTLNNMKFGDNVSSSFDKFIQSLGLTFDEYILSIRFSIQRETIFLQRLPSDIRINNYNPDLLKAWRANLDIQYVLDPYSCAVYILSYITKGQRGMSRLLESACKEAKSGNKELIDQVRHIGNKFLNAVEVSAQEAVYLILQMPLRHSSRQVQFINTTIPDERTFLLKPIEKLRELPDSSDDIESDNCIKRYQRRPKKLENLCLADFIAWYNCTNQKASPNNVSRTTDDFLPENGNDFNDELFDINETQSEEVDFKTEEYDLRGGFKLTRRTVPKVFRSVRYNKNKDPENYYREQLMLYVPWRNEDKDLNHDHGCGTFEEKYESLKDVISKNSFPYEHHSDILDKALDDLQDQSDEYVGSVAPNSQHLDEKDMIIGQKASDLFGCFDPGKNKQHSQYDLLDDIGIFPRSSDNEQLLIKRMDDEQFRELARSLNREQKLFFYHVLHSVKVSDDPLRLFLSGGAGVGKSWVTNALYEALMRYFSGMAGENPDELKVVKVAPTGKAAYNIRGNTVHAAFQIPANKGFQYCCLDTDRLNTIRSKLKNLKVIFIDEISMVGSGMFNFLNLRLQQVLGTKLPFGGVSLIAVGDLFQLQPVFDRWIFENSNSDYAPLATNLWKTYFEMYELLQIMRQKDDKHFAELLNRLREGNHSQADIDELKKRCITNISSNQYNHVTHLFITNALVNSHNDAIFQMSTGQKAEVPAIDIVVGDISEDLKEKTRQRIPKDPTKTMGLYSLVYVTVGQKYDLTSNVSVLDGITNGTECTVCKIDYRVPCSSRPSIIWVLFSDPSIGKTCRQENKHLYNPTIPLTWTPLLEITRQFKITKSKQISILRKQFPIRPSAAKTVHRCQGDTLDEVVVDFPPSTREHMHYVGLSRVRNIDSLHVLRLTENKIKVNSKVLQEMHRLRSTKLLDISYLSLDSISDVRTLKILFENVRSLHLHADDIRCDFNVQAADINIFVETALCANDNNGDYCFEGFQFFRNDIEPQIIRRTPYGTAIYIRNSLQCLSVPFRYNFNDVEITILVVNYLHPIEHVYIVGIYRSKTKVKLSKFIEALDYLETTILAGKATIIFGDFNIDLSRESSERKTLMLNMVQSKGYIQLIQEYTTDYRTQIDHIYTNVPHLVYASGVLESYYSDHKPIYACLRLS